MPLMNSKELAKLAQVMHKYGIVHIKTPEIELMVNPTAPIRKKRHKSSQSENINAGSNTFKGYTDEEILNWSAPLGEDNA